MLQPILSVRRFSLRFPRQYGETAIVRDVSLDVFPGETIGVVGESGSGKTLLSLSMIGLQPKTASVDGAIVFAGKDMRELGPRERRRLRGREIAMIYQDALASLNPGLKIGTQLRQAIGNRSIAHADELLRSVQLEDVVRIRAAYPHELSGGQRQRVLIAMAIAREPRLIIADEPTTALDVTIQAEIMRLLGRLREQHHFALVLVSHDLGLVAGVADRIAVMYAGDLVELGRTRDVLQHPRHPYTAGLVEASRSLEERRNRLAQIAGTVPTPVHFAMSCRFADRCARVGEICRSERPQESRLGTRDTVLCHFPLDGLSHVHDEALDASRVLND